MPLQNVTLCVPRGTPPSNLSKPVVVTHDLPASIPPSHVVLRVERFGFSANNVTYGALGEVPHYRYFDFHPAPKTSSTAPETHGCIPVWGFGTIIASTHPSIKLGERVFGYLAMSRFLVLPVDERGLNAFNFYVPRPHLPEDRRPYNQITRCGKDPLYDPLREDESMIYRPLFWTSFWCHDWLSTSQWHGATHVLISSASSKTAYCLAYLIRKSNASLNKSKRIRTVGLTSPRNVAFTKSLNLYDEILTYDDVSRLPQSNGEKWIYMDVAGSDPLTTSVAKHFNFGPSASSGSSSALVKAVSLGMTNPAGTAPQSHRFLVPFFMPEWLHERRKDLNVIQIAAMQKKGWADLMRDCPPWLKLDRVWGKKGGLEKEYLECVKGSLGPDRGLVFSMWDSQGEYEKTAKL